MSKKIIRTYSVGSDLYDWFNNYAKKNSINKSGFISKKIEELKEKIENQNKIKEQEK